MLWQPTRGLLQPNQSWRRGQGTPATGGFPSLSGTVLARYTAKAGVATSGTDVTTWADQSGNGYTLTGSGTSTGRPQYGATAFNSAYPGIVNVTNTFLVSANRAIATGGTAAMSFWLVYKPTLIGANSRWLATIATVANSIDYQGNGSALVMMDYGATGVSAYVGSAVAITTLTTGTNYRLAMTFGGGFITCYRNGVQQGQDASSAPARWGVSGTDLISLGVNTTMAADGSGNISGFANCGNATYAEIVMMSGLASAGDIAAMDSYFQTEWGL